jgi:tetratricopeptide (TPR) repeat protein
MAAKSLRPETAHVLAHALEQKGELDQAIAVFQDLARLRPKVGRHLTCLAKALKSRGRTEEAKAVLDAATAATSAAVLLKPDVPDAHFNSGFALASQGKLAEAVAEYRTTLRLKPDYAEAHTSLGNALGDQGKLAEAVAEYRTALRLKPDYAGAHYNLGNALYLQGKSGEAVTEYRTALRLKPDYAEAHSNLGVALHDQGKSDEAVAEYRTALRLKPDNAETHNSLGNALGSQGKLAEAIDEYRTALRLEPDYAEAHSNLGNALRLQGKSGEAVTEYRTALRLKPDYAEAHNNLGTALGDQGKLAEAVAESRTALRLKPDFAEAHCNLGLALRREGQFAEALVELKRAHELGSKRPNWRAPSAQWVREAERMVDLEQKLPAFLAGKTRPADAAESLAVAQMFYNKKLHRASARIWQDAFQIQPALADDMKVQNRYNAACTAALAGCGQGKDDPPLDEAAKARWRTQAIDWLKADLMAWSQVLKSGPPQARQFVAKTIEHWKADSDLAGLRDETALAKLPEDEQKACRTLWAEVDALLAKTDQKALP